MCGRVEIVVIRLILITCSAAGQYSCWHCHTEAKKNSCPAWSTNFEDNAKFSNLVVCSGSSSVTLFKPSALCIFSTSNTALLPAFVPLGIFLHMLLMMVRKPFPRLLWVPTVLFLLLLFFFAMPSLKTTPWLKLHKWSR